MRMQGAGSGEQGAWSNEQVRLQFGVHRLKLVLFACVLAIVVTPDAIADTFMFADIEFWVGTGANRAALVIDWRENAAGPPARVWGYRWDGAANGAKMLTDVLAADDRLFAKLGGT